MSTTPIERIIRATTKIMIRSRMPFTSVDIANDIKLRGVWVKNSDVAKRLKQCVERWAEEEGESYTQHQIRVDVGDKGMQTANVYVPTNVVKSDDYLKRDQKAMNPVDFNKVHRTKVMPWNSRIK